MFRLTMPRSVDKSVGRRQSDELDGELWQSGQVELRGRLCVGLTTGTGTGTVRSSDDAYEAHKTHRHDDTCAWYSQTAGTIRPPRNLILDDFTVYKVVVVIIITYDIGKLKRKRDIWCFPKGYCSSTVY